MHALIKLEGNQADFYQKIGQGLIRPFSIVFGHTYNLKDEISEKHVSTTKKVIIIFIATIFLPITLLLGSIGGIMVNYSNSHKKAIKLIQYERERSKNEVTQSNTGAEVSNVIVSNKIETIQPLDQSSNKKMSNYNSVYNEVIRRVDNIDLNKKLDSLPNKETKLAYLMDDLNQKDWNFQYLDYPYYALLALREELITQIQFGTIMMYWSAVQCHGKHNVQAIPLFEIDGNYNATAYKYIQQTLGIKMYAPKIKEYSDGLPLLSTEELNRLFEKMRELPVSEQRIFIVPQEKPILSDEIVWSTGINVFNQLRNEPDSLRMIPSVGLCQTFVEVLNPLTYTTVNPVLGHSSDADIELNGRNKTRDMAFNFPDVPLPHRAHSHYAPWYDFTYHDFYHLILSSAIPSKYSNYLIDIGHIIKEKSNFDFELSNHIIDVELPPYRRDWRRKANKENQKDDIYVFWQALAWAFWEYAPINLPFENIYEEIFKSVLKEDVALHLQIAEEVFSIIPKIKESRLESLKPQWFRKQRLLDKIVIQV